LALLPPIPLTFVYVRWVRRSAQPLGRATLFLRAGSIAFISVLASFVFLSWFMPMGLCSGHAEIGFCRGDVVLVQRTHDELDHTQPWRLAPVGELWAVQDYFNRRFENGVLPGQFLGNMNDGGAAVFDQWTSLFGFAIPLWELAVLVMIANLAMCALSALRSAVRNAQPGFPVIAPSKPTGPTTSV
jgi:hypothetical protein